MANLIKKEFQKNWVLIMKMQKYADEINILLCTVHCINLYQSIYF